MVFLKDSTCSLVSFSGEFVRIGDLVLAARCALMQCGHRQRAMRGYECELALLLPIGDDQCRSIRCLEHTLRDAADYQPGDTAPAKR